MIWLVFAMGSFLALVYVALLALIDRDDMRCERDRLTAELLHLRRRMLDEQENEE
jgi:hypothetical protein